MTPAILQTIITGRQARRPVLLATRLSDGAQFLPDDPGCPAGVAAAFVDASTRCLDVDGARWFLQAFLPSPRLLIIGAVHAAQFLAPMARLAGFDVTVIDPRRHFATADRFQHTSVLPVWPDDQAAIALMDAHSAVVTLSHDPRIDDPALQAALGAGCFYVGSLGSAKTHVARLERFRQAGFSEDILARIRGPVGLRLGSSEASSIAVSILAEIIAVRSGAALGQR